MKNNTGNTKLSRKINTNNEYLFEKCKTKNMPIILGSNSLPTLKIWTFRSSKIHVYKLNDVVEAFSCTQTNYNSKSKEN